MEPGKFGSARSGEFTAQHITPLGDGELNEDAIQPNGVELSIGELYRLEGEGRLRNKEYTKPKRVEVLPVSGPENWEGQYKVDPDNSYVIKYSEKIHIPDAHVGLVFPRSRLMRSGLGVETAVWEAGYTGVGEGRLTVGKPAKIEEGMRVAQIILIKTEELENLYDGSHQKEGL